MSNANANLLLKETPQVRRGPNVFFSIPCRNANPGVVVTGARALRRPMITTQRLLKPIKNHTTPHKIKKSTPATAWLPGRICSRADFCGPDSQSPPMHHVPSETCTHNEEELHLRCVENVSMSHPTHKILSGPTTGWAPSGAFPQAIECCKAEEFL